MKKLGGVEGRLAVLCLLLFGFGEAAVTLSAFSNPEGFSLLRILEGPLSLLLLVAVFYFALRALAEKPKLQLLLAAGLLLLATLAVIPVCSPHDSPYRIEVRKSERLLRLCQDNDILAEYPIALGDPVGDKEFAGDGKTPLGQFRIVSKAPSQFHLWMGLNYPTSNDAWRGRLNGQITWLEFWYIRVENLNGRIPYSSSSLGGAVGLHGGGADNDWTLGCIALNNKDVERLYRVAPLGTEVLIEP